MKKRVGVHIDLGNKASKIAYAHAKKTFSNRLGKKGQPASAPDGNFSNLLLFGEERIGIGSDGIGTKAEIAERLTKYNTLGFDLVAMVADDLAVMGFEPAVLSNVLDVDIIDIQVIDELMEGLEEACTFASMAVTGGEIAELGNRVGGYGTGMHFNWSATALGHLPEFLEEPVNGSRIQTGDVIIALQSRGMRSNGFSAARGILKSHYGDTWHLEKFDDNHTWGEKLLTPSLIYAPLITEAIQNRIIPSGMVHITGGGIVENLKRILKVTAKGAMLNNLFPPHTEMLRLMEMAKLPPGQAYQQWNMGNGFLVIISSGKAEDFFELARQNNYQAQIAGEITGKHSIHLQTDYINSIIEIHP